MSKHLYSKLKFSRREGTDLFFKSGIKPIDKKCKFNKYPGYQISKRISKLSNYGLQLREKQKVKRMYCVFENQFFNYYKKSLKIKGNVGKNLLIFLETRLDNVIYKIGFASTIFESKQIISHKFILINYKLVNLCSYKVKVNDIISINNKKNKINKIYSSFELCKNKKKPNWIDIDEKNMSCIIKKLPDRKDISSDIDENLVIEFYSK